MPGVGTVAPEEKVVRYFLKIVPSLSDQELRCGQLDRLAKATLFTGLVALSFLASARAETVAGKGVRISFQGRISPSSLPRSVPAPVALHVAGTVGALGDESPAALERLTVQVNRHAHFSTHGLPSCPRRRLGGTSTGEALSACGEALLGSGHFTSHIEIPEQAPFPARGRVLAFNTTREDRPAIAIHVFGRKPASITTVLGAAITRSGPASSSLGPRLTIEMPKIGDDWGYVSSFDLTLHRRYRYRGRNLSVVTATCPAPTDLDKVPFKAARGTFELADGQTLTRTVSGTCRATD
jgi:hypothetical protein